MTTNYDDIYKPFKAMTQVSAFSLPNSDEALYALIDNARRIYNMTLYTNIAQDDATETFNIEMNDLQILLMCRCMRLVTFKNMQTEFTSMISMGSKDSALKDYSAQVEGRGRLVQEEQESINRLALSLLEIGDEA